MVVIWGLQEIEKSDVTDALTCMGIVAVLFVMPDADATISTDVVPKLLVEIIVT